MFQQLGTTWTVAAGVVIATVGVYFTFIALVRAVGQRSLASMSSFDFGCAVALGAVMGRTVLLTTPTLVSGMIAWSPCSPSKAAWVCSAGTDPPTG